MTGVAGISDDQIKALVATPTQDEINRTQHSVALLAQGAEQGSDMTHPDVVALTESVQAVHERITASLRAAREVGEILDNLTDEEKWMAAADASDRVVEMVTGYKARWVNNGFSETMAEHMALQFHAMLVAGTLQQRAQ